MAWYEGDRSIKKDRPIFASKGDRTYVLLPQMKENTDFNGVGYAKAGYNWFNINTGYYNSCKFYPTVEAAIESYSTYQIFNGALKAWT